MIERFKFLRNIGPFDNVAPQQENSLKSFSLVYGGNGCGKTTLAAILRSLATNEPSWVTDRHRLGAQHPPHVVISHSDGECVFQEGEWKQPLTQVKIFDDSFVAANVCSGIELQPAHRQNLHELILGAKGVNLNNKVQKHVARIEEHNAKIRHLEKEIPQTVRGPFGIDAFCDLEQDPDIDGKIQDAERRRAAAHDADKLRQHSGFQAFKLPDFDLDAIDAVLKRDLAGLDAAAADRVRAHIAGLGPNGEAWVSDGMAHIEPESQGHDGNTCPFCAQDIGGSDLIVHYRAYFSQAYKDLKNKILQIVNDIRNAHAEGIQSAFERDIRIAVQAREFWKTFIALPEFELDTAVIAHQWNAAREGVLEQIRAKGAAPLEPMVLSPAVCEAVGNYHKRSAEVAELSTKLCATNDQIDVLKENAQTEDIASLTDEIGKLKALKVRFDPDVMRHCKAYTTEKIAKKKTESLRDQARKALDQYRKHTFPAYKDALNKYLERFGASFRLGNVTHVNNKSGSSASYCVVINQEQVNVTAKEGPSFRNTLSAGDRNTLALAFFFASLEKPQTGEQDHRH